MKKIGLGILIVITVLALSGIAAAISNQAADISKEKISNQNNHSEFKPIPARDVKIVKKVTIKGRPTWAGGPGGPNGEEEGAATGILGALVSGTRYAIVVGISDYPGTGNDLRYCDDDAIEMRDALVGADIYGFDPENITLLMDLDATRCAILSAIESISTDAGEVVFFFSGYGTKGVADDGDRERIDEAIAVHDSTNIVPIWDGELKAAFSGFDTSRIIF